MSHNNLFEQLLAFKWRDVEFPVTSMRVALAQDLVLHQYWGVDSARVEATGVAPVRFSASIPAINGLSPGHNERWTTLYPTMMRSLLAAMADKSTGFLQHPELGLVRVKPERIEFNWSGDHQGGCLCEASWVETLPENESHDVQEGSPVTGIAISTQSLDESQVDLKALIPTFPTYQQSWGDFARSIQSIGDQITLISGREAGKIKALVYRVDQVEDSIARAKSALTCHVQHDLERIKSHANDLQANLLKDPNRRVVLYLVPGDTTVGGLLCQLPEAKLGDVIALNPQLMNQALVSKGTMVRYYVPRNAA